MGELEDLLVPAFEGKRQAFLTVIVTGNGVREWQWYAREKDAIMEVIEQVSRHLQPQAGFADAASTGKGQQVHIWTPQERTRNRHLLFAPN